MCIWRRAKEEGLNFEECQLWKSGRRGSSNGDYEGAAMVKSGNDDVLMIKGVWGMVQQ